MLNKRTQVVIICVLTLAAVPIAVTAADFSISTDETIDVADRTVEQGGNTFEITSVTQVDPSDQITVSVDAPDDADFTMYMYDENQTIVRGYEGSGSTSFDVPVADHGASEAGTYAFIVQSDGVNEAAHPMVVRGYSVSSNSPGSVTVGDSVSVNGEFTKLRGESFDRIDIVVAATDTDEQVVKEANIDDETFSASVSTDDLESGSYDVYAVVRGSDEVLGEQEILGLSSPQLLQLEENESENTEENSGGGGGGGGGGGAAPADSTEDEETSDSQEQASLDDGPITRPVTDNDPDQGGVNVPVNAGPITQVSFDISNEDATGELTVSRSSETTETFESQFGADRVKTAVSITVPDTLADTTATVEFTLTGEELDGVTPSNLQVVKSTDGGVQVLSSTTEETQNGSVSVTARTPGFSDFAVITAPSESEPEADSNATVTENATTTNETAETETTTETNSSADAETEPVNEETPGFGPVVALIAVVMITLIGTRRR